MCLVTVALAISIPISLVLILYKAWGPYNYWRKRGVTGPKALPIFGNYASVIFGIKTEAQLLREIYEKCNDDFVGIYKGVHPVLLIKHPDVIKQVLIKDFDSFNTRCIEKSLSSYSKSLLIMEGDDKWKAWRRIFTPGMMSDKIQMMIPLVKNSLTKHLRYIDDMLEKCSLILDIHDIQKKCVLDVFSKLIFNISQEEYIPYDEFKNIASDFINSKLQMSLQHVLELISPPGLSAFLNVPQFSADEFNSVRNYMLSFIHKVEIKGAKRNNFLEFMISMKEKNKTRKDKDLPMNIDDDIILQQSLTFFLTAYESTSTVSAFVFYELANNQGVQEKCINEIEDVFNENEEYTMKLLNKLKYLQTVIEETMRKHTLAQAIDRRCVAEYTFPGTDLTIDKGVYVLVPVHGLHNDAKYFPEPEKFKPERFSEDNKVKIPQSVYLPFGDGPRMCIGQRLAKIVMLIVISAFLRKYKVSPSTEMKDKLKYDQKRTRNLAPLGGIWLIIEKR